MMLIRFSKIGWLDFEFIPSELAFVTIFFSSSGLNFKFGDSRNLIFLLPLIFP